MKLLFASDSFKGSLTSTQIIELLTRAAEEVFDHPDCMGVAVADGGEGTIDAVLQTMDGQRIYTEVHGPLMESITAYYGKVSKHKAVIEMAIASGLPLVPASQRNPLNTTTYGTGELIKHAIDHGFHDIMIAIGGSATNDGGIGCMRALGARFLDANGDELPGFGRDLINIADIDISELLKNIEDTQITVMCDVTNPLCGVHGATYTFGKQKGGSQEILDELEQGMQNYRNVLVRKFGVDPDDIQGAGAAGGLGAALMIFMKGRMMSGIEAILDMIGFDEKLKDVDLVITGEGCTDWQSCYGKVVQGVGERCKKHHVPAVVLSGSMGKGAEQIFDHGICSLMTTVNEPMGLEEAMSDAEQLYYSAAIRMFRMIDTGYRLADGRSGEIVDNG